MEYGTILVGAPGSGKTTACHGMQQFYNLLDRSVAVVNLDPANDVVPYSCDLNISDLISVDDVMSEFGLGPNGAMIYCMEYLEKNISWLLEGLSKLKGRYFIFDFPGQVELYTHNKSVKDLLEKLRKAGFQLTVLHLIDAHLCTDPFKYVAALVLSLKVMLQLELPHVNVLSKIDLIQSYGTLAFDLDYYTEVQDLGYLIEKLEQDKYGKRLSGLTRALCDLIEEFGLVHFHTLCINDKASVLRICQEVEKANGFVYLEAMSNHEKFFNSVAPADMMYNQYIQDIKEKYVDPVLEV